VIWVLVCVLALAGVAAVIAGALRGRRWWWIGLGGLLALAGLAIGYAHITRSPDAAPLDPNPSSSFRIVALGDSFISGEGADRYFPGTDEGDPEKRNLCHRASTAYPYMVAEALEASLHLYACSGARTGDVIDHAQYPDSPSDVAGGRKQLDMLKQDDPDLVLISIGGNDAGFAEIGIDCAFPGLPDCRGDAPFWLHRLADEVYPRLVKTFRRVRLAAHGAPVFALTYPNLLGPKFCPDLAGLGEGEMAFVRDVFAPRLNGIVKSAAASARVRVIDLEDAFAGYRFCEVPLGRAAANFLALEHTDGSPVTRFGDLVRGSLHPNPLGHRLLEKAALPTLRAAEEGQLPPLPRRFRR
jgi:lysophospholipase L1-like esterase